MGNIDERVGRPLACEEGETITAAQIVRALHSFIVEHARPSHFDHGAASDYVNGYRGALDDLKYEIDRTLQSSAWRGGSHLT